MDESALETANCLLLSENKLACVLLNRQEEDQMDVYRIVPSGDMITTSDPHYLDAGPGLGV